MKSVKQIWEETAKQLEKVYASREAENITRNLFEDLLRIKEVDVLSNSSLEIDEDQLKAAVDRLLNHEPVQYVTGVAYFYGRSFHLQPGALIPRPETEELVDLIVRDNLISNPRIADVGVGSGCIAITLALELKGEVFATDNSNEALTIARSNADKLNSPVNFYIHNILAEQLPFNELDILVSNPPYIPDQEKSDMHLNVVRYEPEMALFVPDDHPLIFYHRLAEAGNEALRKGGKLYLEIHERFGNEVKNLLESMNYGNVTIHQDMQGKDRMVSAVKG